MLSQLAWFALTSALGQNFIFLTIKVRSVIGVVGVIGVVVIGQASSRMEGEEGMGDARGDGRCWCCLEGRLTVLGMHRHLLLMVQSTLHS